MIQKHGSAFLLCGKDYAYAMRVTQTRFLQHLHFGGKISESDLAALSALAESSAPQADDLNKDMKLNGMQSEYGFYAHGDFHDPTAIFERGDGAAMSRLRYVSSEIIEGAPKIDGMPHVRTADETLAITLKDDFSDVEVVLYYAVCENANVLTRHAVIRNTGKGTVMLKKAFSFRVDLPRGEYKALRLGGMWGQERIPSVTPVGHGITRVQSLHGRSSHETNPFLGILGKGCEEETGDCYGVQLVYSGNFAITAEWSKVGSLCVQGGVCDVNFGWELKGGDEFITPQALLCYSGEGLGGMSRAFHDFLRERMINPNYVGKPRPIVVNHWEATEFTYTGEKLFPIIDAAKETGIDTFVLDDGWFGKRDDEKSGLGDWFVNEQKLKGGLDQIIGRCKQNGLKFGLWFEPEMVSEDSDLFRLHPDWAFAKQGVEPVRGRWQLVLDFTKNEVVDYIFESMSKILCAHEISYVKWDMNRCITEAYSASLPVHRMGEVMHRYVLGVYDLCERLIKGFPQVFFEGCSSGGGRFDAGMLYYFPQIWTSDLTDAWERAKIQWGTSLGYPLSSMSCHVSACPNCHLKRVTPLSTRGAIASLGATGYELDISKMTDEELMAVKEQIKQYRAIESVILGGDLYRLYNPLETNYFCEMVVSKDKWRAYVAGMCSLTSPCEFNQRIFLKGLDGSAQYEVEELGITLSGNALMNAGLFLPKLDDFGSFVWHLQVVEK